ncbi:MAG TPA: hypothetical protein VJ787_03745, partial [Thermoleophilia bacterium]|nr:hypothetical protein [Thermoleophilia bacterium]
LALGRTITSDPAADEAEAREGMLIAGYCLAAVGRVSDAEDQFRAAVAEDVRLEAGFPMEHRVQYLLEAARSDEVQRRVRRAAAARVALAAQVSLLVAPPEAITGGQRASFEVRVTGPAAERITSVKLQFRRPTDPEFYSLPVRRSRDGVWRGEIGGIYTASTRAYSLRWFVTASDERGELVSHGNREDPLPLSVASGKSVAADLHARERLPPETRLLIACVGAPSAVMAAALLTLAGAGVIDLASAAIVGQGSQSWGLATLLLAPLTMALAEAGATMFLVEGDVAWWPAALVAGAGLVVDIPIALALLKGQNLESFLVVPGDGDEPVDLTGQAYGGGALVVLASGVAATVPVAMILWEAGQYVE